MISKGYINSRSTISRGFAVGPRAILVCGVDISESTALKIRYPRSGVSVISAFMESFDRALRGLNHRAESVDDTGWFLWRVRGDELVYLREIPVGDDDIPDLAIVSKALQEFIESIELVSIRLNTEPQCSLNLRSYSFILHSQGNPWNYRWHLMPKELGGALKNKVNPEYVYGNLGEFSLRDIQKDYFIDFIGVDVDLGFRVAEQSQAYRMIMSPYLAYLVMLYVEKQGGNLLDVHFMGARELKGCSIEETGLIEYPLYYIPMSRKFLSHEGSVDESMQINISKEIKKLEEFEKFRNDSYQFIYEKALKHASADES